MKRIVLHPEAEQELRESMNFYKVKAGEELAHAFDVRLRLAFRAIAENPQRFPRALLSPKAQKCRVIRFPFSVYYLDQKNRVWILAIAHHKRHPAYWRRRLR